MVPTSAMEISRRPSRRATGRHIHVIAEGLGSFLDLMYQLARRSNTTV